MLPFYHGCFYGAEKAVTRILHTVQCFTDAADISFIGIISDFQILTIVVIKLE
jgi:hypothetical protein